MGLGGGVQSVPRRYVQNRNYVYNSCRKLFKMLEIYNSIGRYSDSNIRAKFDPKIALVLRNWRCLQFGVKKKNDFQKLLGGNHICNIEVMKRLMTCLRLSLEAIDIPRPKFELQQIVLPNRTSMTN